MIICNYLVLIIQSLFNHYLNYLNYLTYLTYSTYLTYLTYLILFDLESSHYLTGRAAKFLIINDMETASLQNERLGTQLKECQDALEAQTRQVQAKDCRITHSSFTFIKAFVT